MTNETDKTTNPEPIIYKDYLQVDTEEYNRQRDIYSLLREQIKHEDSLINDRINWSLTAQGYLFVAYSALLINLGITKTVYGFFIPSVIAILGIVLCLTAYSGVASAMASLERIHAFMNQKNVSDKKRGIVMGLPEISGAGAWKNDRIFGANVNIRGIPLVFCFAWAVLLVVPFFLR